MSARTDSWHSPRRFDTKQARDARRTELARWECHQPPGGIRADGSVRQGGKQLCEDLGFSRERFPSLRQSWKLLVVDLGLGLV